VFRQRIRDRYRELDAERATLNTRLADLEATQPVVDNDDPAILDTLPIITGPVLANLPDTLFAHLADAFRVSIRIDTPTSAHMQLTITGESADTVRQTIAATPADPAATTLNRVPESRLGITTISAHGRW